MLLTDVELEEEWRLKRVVFKPDIDPARQITTVSIDLRLGDEFRTPEPKAERVFRPGRIAPPVNVDELYGPPQRFPSGQCYQLEPGDFVLGHSFERITMPLHLGAVIDGKSVNARFGLSIHATSAKVDPGFEGQIVLEISNLGKNTLLLDPGMIICQLLFFRVSTRPKKGYSGMWQRQIATGR
ncbi:MAG: dCTP deaminase [Dehalococcoidia bacterium]